MGARQDVVRGVAWFAARELGAFLGINGEETGAKHQNWVRVMDDYPTKSRSNEEVQKLAKQLLRFFEVPIGDCVDVLACLKKETILTVRGVERLVYKVLPDRQMGTNDAVTGYENGAVTITVKKSVHEKARFGDGRARNTLAHELGHAVMHDGAPKARKTGAAGNKTARYIKPYESAEHQAKVFAPAFLIDDERAATCKSAEEISVNFVVSLESAKIFFDTLERESNRAEAARRVAQKTAAFCAPVPNPGPPNYMTERCTSCGQQTLSSSGPKFRCATCGNVIDRFQDGDSLDP